MFKTAQIFITLLIAALLLPACTRKQAPTPSDRIGNGMGDSDRTGLEGDFIPAHGLGSDYGLGAEGLESRGSDGSGISNGMYNGREMVEGVIPSVYFGFDSSSISTTERSKLQQAADHLRDNPSDGLLLEGHCDWYGTADYNIALGERRAMSAKDYITTLGISPSRVETLSKGSLESTAGLSKGDSAEDRRADVIILK
ncbi:MAG: OmpA family protein [Opitutaceae bacterium]